MDPNIGKYGEEISTKEISKYYQEDLSVTLEDSALTVLDCI
jgi:hypothetical protein